MNQAQGLVLRCDSQGNIAEILSDSINFGAQIQIGMPFARLAVRGGLEKALSFIAELNTLGEAYDWEITFSDGNNAKIMHCTGSKNGESMLIVAAESGNAPISD